MMLWTRLALILLVALPFILSDNYEDYFTCYYNKYNKVENASEFNPVRQSFVEQLTLLSKSNR